MARPRKGNRKAGPQRRGRPQRGGQRGGNRLQRLAQQEAELQFTPEEQALRGLLREAQGTLNKTIAAETGGAAVTVQALKEARPVLRRQYQSALGSYESGKQLLDRDLNALGAAADPFKAVSAREYEGAKRRLLESSTGALTELEQRKIDAVTGAQYAVRQAHQGYRSDVAKVRAQQQDLGRQRGTFTRTAYEKLLDAEAEAQMDRAQLRLDRLGERRLQRSAEADLTGVDPVTGRPTAEEQNRRRDDRRSARDGSGGGKDGPPRGAITRHQDIVADVQDAKGAVLQLRRNGVGWGDIRTVLMSNKTEKNPFGGHRPVVAQAAMQLQRRGALNSTTVSQLRSQGLLPRRMPSGWKPTFKTGSGIREGARGKPRIRFG